MKEIIYTIDGKKLSLTPTRLQQIDHDTSLAFFTRRSDLAKAKATPRGIRIYSIGALYSNYSVSVSFDCTCHGYMRNIGCAKFTPETFAHIFKVMGLRVPRRKKAA